MVSGVHNIMRFKEFYTEAPMPPPPQAGGMGGMPPIGGGIGGAPLPTGGGMAPPMMGGGLPPAGGLGGGPMGGMQQPQQSPVEVQTKDVWSLLEKILTGKPVEDKKQKAPSPPQQPNPQPPQGMQQQPVPQPPTQPQQPAPKS